MISSWLFYSPAEFHLENPQPRLEKMNMISKPSHAPSAPACIEMLESRRLLSASLGSHVAAAVKTPAPIPVVTGAPFVGTIGPKKDHIGLTIAFTSEGTTGAVVATVTGTQGSSTNIFQCTGTVKNTGAVVLHGKLGKETLTISGKLNKTDITISGHGALKGKLAIGGSFKASR
jgi:hypothetical protein